MGARYQDSNRRDYDTKKMFNRKEKSSDGDSKEDLQDLVDKAIKELREMFHNDNDDSDEFRNFLGSFADRHDEILESAKLFNSDDYDGARNLITSIMGLVHYAMTMKDGTVESIDSAKAVIMTIMLDEFGTDRLKEVKAIRKESRSK